MSATISVRAVMNNAVYVGGTSNWQTPGYIRGNVRVMIDYYVALGTEAAGTVLALFPTLEAGSVIMAIVLSTTVGQTSLTFSLGDQNSATRYITTGQTTLQSASTGVLIYSPFASATTGPYVIGTNPTTSGVWSPTSTNTDAQIILTTGGATMVAGVIGAIMLYTID